MITVYTLEGTHITGRDLPHGVMPPTNALWIDLQSPEDNERVFISTALGIDLPNQQEMHEIEASSRLYAEDNTLYMTTDILIGFDTPDPGLDVLLIALAPTCLVTVRYCEPRAINIFAGRIRNQPDLFTKPEDGLLTLLDSITDRTADIIETLGRRVDALSQEIFHAGEHKATPNHKERRLHEILQGIGRAGDTTHKIRDSVNGMTRLTTFLGARAGTRFNHEQAAKYKAVESDLRSLAEHAQFLGHETTFLLDATLGQINIEQNAIIKIFSVVAVIFLPPTLFASIWGMNFHHMPELSWEWGYGMAIVTMLISAILPIAFFKRKGWL